MNEAAEKMAETAPADNASAGAECCALARLPESFWRALIRPPFRKRHPFIFWGGLVLLAILLGYLLAGIFKSEEAGSGRDSIALVSIQGPILEAGPTLAWIRRVERNNRVKGILVRVNSPGGGAAASQEIYAALKRVGAKKPIVVSMGATAASGGLMISMAGERIYANPSTVTGSIGVRMDIPQLQGLMQKIGIGQETLVTAPYKDAASYTHPMTPEDRAYLQAVLENMHDQFVDIVAEGRKMSREKAAALANGKICTGQQAQKLGLVDELGGQDAAHQWLSDKLGIPVDQKLVTRPSEKTRLLELLKNGFRAFSALASEASDLSGRLSQPAFLYQY